MKTIMKTTCIVLIILALAACQSKNEKSNESADGGNVLKAENEEFSAYINNFKQKNLPLTIKGCMEDITGLAEFDGEKYKTFNEDFSFSYGQIPTNGEYIALITLGAADCFLPILTTYKLNGQIIDKKTIAIGYCGMDCGYYCEEFMSISDDYKIYTSDTISTYKCDDQGNEIPGTYEYYLIFKEGKLLDDGKIQLSEEQKKPLEGRIEHP